MERFERILLDKAVADDERARSILLRLGGVPVETVDGTSHVLRIAQSLKDPLGQGKRLLFLSSHKGRMVGICPGTSGHICCGYRILDLMSNCPMDCSYCVLQSYLNNPVVTVFTNLSDLIDELEMETNRPHSSVFRVGPGELSDSLALDELTRFSEELIAWFADHRDTVLELKTKHSRVDHLLNFRHNGRTVVSWSLNPQAIIEAEEHDTPSLIERLKGARMCQDAGYPIGLHFDPLIFDDYWEKKYQEMVNRIFQFLDSKGVIWISMGSLRFPPSLKRVIEDRFPESRILLGELFPGKDGKLRYLEPIRVGMFQKMISWIRDIDSTLFVYLCMETHPVWKAVFGWSPNSTEGLIELFDRRCRDFMRSSR